MILYKLRFSQQNKAILLTELAVKETEKCYIEEMQNIISPVKKSRRISKDEINYLSPEMTMYQTDLNISFFAEKLSSFLEMKKFQYAQMVKQAESGIQICNLASEGKLEAVETEETDEWLKYPSGSEISARKEYVFTLKEDM